LGFDIFRLNSMTDSRPLLFMGFALFHRYDLIAKYRIDESKRELRFTEMLKESGFGLSGGQDVDDSPGFGFKKETYRTGGGGRQGTIEAQSTLFEKRYRYTFDWQSIRGAVQAAAHAAGMAFTYQNTASGL
jgi:hypothetical protein